MQRPHLGSANSFRPLLLRTFIQNLNIWNTVFDMFKNILKDSLNARFFTYLLASSRVCLFCMVSLYPERRQKRRPERDEMYTPVNLSLFDLSGVNL